MVDARGHKLLPKQNVEEQHIFYTSVLNAGLRRYACHILEKMGGTLVYEDGNLQSPSTQYAKKTKSGQLPNRTTTIATKTTPRQEDARREFASGEQRRQPSAPFVVRRLPRVLSLLFFPEPAVSIATTTNTIK